MINSRQTRMVTIVITGPLWHVVCHLYSGRKVGRTLNTEQMVRFCDACGFDAREGKHWPNRIDR